MEDKVTKRRKKRKSSWGYYAIPCLIFLIGLGILLYPFISNLLYSGGVKQQKKQFELSIQNEQELPFEELYQKLKEENQRLYTEKQSKLNDPWAYEQTAIDLSEYGLEDNTIGFVKIEKMKVELPIILGANTKNMELGAVHLTETSYPIGGENTNSVIAAHRGFYEAEMFRHIEKLELGDEVLIKNFREELTYEVVEIRIINPDDVDQLLIQEGRDMITLLTCHPYTSNAQRYVVFCERKE